MPNIDAPAISRRLVIENDERLYTASDRLWISHATGILVMFDVFHHSVHNNGEVMDELLDQISTT